MNEFPTHDELRDLLGAYVVDAVDDGERRLVTDHLSDCPECSDEVKGLREATTAYAAGFETAAPAGSEERVLKAIRQTPQPEVVSAAGVVRDLSRPTRHNWLLAAAAVIAGLAIGVLGLAAYNNHVRVTAAQQVMEVATAPDAHIMPVPIPSAGTSFVVSMSMDKAALMSSSLPMPAEGHVYQVWAKAKDGTMTSAAMFTPSTSGHAAVVLDANVRDTSALMITVEPHGGSAQPTQPPIAEVQL